MASKPVEHWSKRAAEKCLELGLREGAPEGFTNAMPVGTGATPDAHAILTKWGNAHFRIEFTNHGPGKNAGAYVRHGDPFFRITGYLKPFKDGKPTGKPFVDYAHGLSGGFSKATFQSPSPDTDQSALTGELAHYAYRAMCAALQDTPVRRPKT